MAIPWNKGLTKSDPRVKKYHENSVKTRLKEGSYKANSGTFEKGQTRAHYPKGRKNPKGAEKRRGIFRGKYNPAWKGGITKFSQIIRTSDKYIEWRNAVYKRDNWTCQNCGKRCKRKLSIFLEAHHKKKFSKILEENNIRTFEQAMQCKELWELDNGKTLCRKCHLNER